MTPREVWTSQCEVAREILVDSGVEDALSYLIGCKFLDFLLLAEDYPGWREEIPSFVTEIRDVFAPWQIAEHLGAAKSVGRPVSISAGDTAFGDHVPAGAELTYGSARNKVLLERAARLLTP